MLLEGKERSQTPLQERDICPGPVAASFHLNRRKRSTSATPGRNSQSDRTTESRLGVFSTGRRYPSAPEASSWRPYNRIGPAVQLLAFYRQIRGYRGIRLSKSIARYPIEVVEAYIIVVKATRGANKRSIQSIDRSSILETS